MHKSDRILTLNIGSHRVVLAEFSVVKGEGPELLNYGVADLGIEPDSNQDTSAFIVTAVRDIMREQGIRSAPLMMTVSGQSVFPRFVKLPPVASDKIYQIVQYEAEQNVPFPMDEVVWDYQLIGEDEDDLSVMLVAAKIESVRQVTDAVSATGMEPEIVDVAPMALYNSVRYNYPDLDGCTMVLDIGARASSLIFFEGARIFSRSIPVAGNAITQELAKEFDLSFEEAEELKLQHAFVAFGGVYAGPDSEVADRVSKIVRNVVTRLHAEVNRSINFYRSQQQGDPPSLVLMTGGSSVIPHMDTFFREKLKVQVEYLNPFSGVAVNEAVDTDRVSADLQWLAVPVGLALRRSLSCPIEIDLMPPELVKKKTFRRRQPFFGLAAAGVIMIVLCWSVYASKMRQMLDDQTKKVRDQITSLDGLQRTLKRLKKGRIAAVNGAGRVANLIRLRTLWLEMSRAIHDKMFDGMWLTAIRPDVSADGTKITHIWVEGQGFEDRMKKAEVKLETSAVAAFLKALRETPFFVEKGELGDLVEPSVAPGAFAREFEVRVALVQPIVLVGEDAMPAPRKVDKKKANP